MQADIIRLSINKDLKLKEKKGKEKISSNARSYISFASTITSTITTALCQCRNKGVEAKLEILVVEDIQADFIVRKVV